MGIYLLQTTFAALLEWMKGVSNMSPNEKDRNLGLMKARAMHRYFVAAAPKPPKLRRRLRPHQSRTKLRNAIDESHGNWAVLANLLDCCVSTVQRALERPEYELLLQAFNDERMKSLERCVQNVYDIAHFSLDVQARLKANTFLLQQLHADFQRSSKVTIEGGDKPVQVQQTVLQIPAEVLDLPIDAQLKMLEAADAREKELGVEVDD